MLCCYYPGLWIHKKKWPEAGCVFFKAPTIKFMTKMGHRKTGVGLALCGAAVALYSGYSGVEAIVVDIVAMAASSLPDSMEMKWWSRGQRYSLIPHRTATHWLLPWVSLATWLIWDIHHQQTVPIYANAILLGVAFGCIGHITMDCLTPMGVPIINPFSRSSLRLIKSGNPAVEGGVAAITAALGMFLLASAFLSPLFV